jgi:hypothetical protein
MKPWLFLRKWKLLPYAGAMLVYFGTGGSAEGLVKAQEGTEGAEPGMLKLQTASWNALIHFLSNWTN